VVSPRTVSASAVIVRGGADGDGGGQTILILVRNNTGGLPIQVKQVTFTPT
jgi:hypothetical protein